LSKAAFEEGPLLAQSGRSCASSINGRLWNFSTPTNRAQIVFGQSKSRDRNFIAAKERLGSQISGCLLGKRVIVTDCNEYNGVDIVALFREGGVGGFWDDGG